MFNTLHSSHCHFKLIMDKLWLVLTLAARQAWWADDEMSPNLQKMSTILKFIAIFGFAMENAFK